MTKLLAERVWHTGKPARFRALSVSFCLLLLTGSVSSRAADQPLTNQTLEDRDPGRRTDRLLASAEAAFDNARVFYGKGEIQNGDAQLEEMLNVLRGCADSLDAMRKSKFYKKAELRVASLQRRMQGLVEDVGVEDRGWAEYTQRKLEEVHEQLLSGVMRK